MSSGISFRVNDILGFNRDIATAQVSARKAAINAVKIEAYRMTKILKAEIRAGAPGGQAFAPLRYIRTRGLLRFSSPLKRLSIPPRYFASAQNGTDLRVMFGFLYIKSSRRWMQIAKSQQEGYEMSPDTPNAGTLGMTPRRLLRLEGARLKKAKSPLAKYFFLKKSTNTLITPSRPIIVPFWQAHQDRAGLNIAAHFERLCQGERIFSANLKYTASRTK